MPTIAETFNDQWIESPGPLNTPCWIWQRARSGDGYGHFKLNGKWKKAHRHAYELEYGPVLSSVLICHKCDTPLCINPSHLWAGNNSENMKDALNKGRRAPLILHGEQHGMSILTETKVLSIRAKINNGIRQCDVAPEFDISPSLVYRIKKRIIWTRV